MTNIEIYSLLFCCALRQVRSFPAAVVCEKFVGDYREKENVAVSE